MTDEIKVGKVAMIKISSITLGERARQEMGNLNEVENSIKEVGLVSPIAVKQIGEDTYLLLAGERRFQVLSRNNVNEVPARIYPSDISDIDMKTIELAENYYRKDFEYHESDKLIRQIHELKQAQFGQKFTGGKVTSGWSLKDTAELAGVTDASVCNAIKRAELHERFPELFSDCKTQKDASNVIKKLDEMVTKEAIAKQIEDSKLNGKINQLAKCYINKDFFEGIKGIPDGLMHLVEIDPPYAIDLNNTKRSEGESAYIKDSYNEVNIDEYKTFISNVFKECYRVMTDHSWLLCWFAPEPWFEEIYKAIKLAGFETTRMCGVWTKPTGQSNRPEMHLSNTYEMFFYAWKGRPALNKQGRSNNFQYPPVPPQSKTHPTERPVELMKEIYETFAFPGSRILIPFLGSGNGIIAADQLGMSAIGFELSKSYRDSFLVKVHNSK